ncbi:MATE family efflux transporter, partial [Mailhella sp.]|uniref:MATE family efflux transporter n=1 Tax=Mailhella sp. TaxID=1981029 RepID=UPI003AB838DE
MFSFHKKTIDIRLLLRLTLPIFLELLLQLLVGNVDKVMVGDDYSATAINQANSILDMLTVSLSVLSAASLILISQYKGAQNRQKERQIYVLSFYFNLAVSLGIGILLSVLARPVLSAIHVQPEIMDEAVIYLRVTGGGLFLQAIMLSLSAFLRSNTYMKQCLLVAFLFNVINISGNALFLWGFGMKGAIAVAIPSVLSRLIGALILFYEVKKYLRLDLSARRLRHCRREELIKILKIGLPSCGESISYSFSQIVILAIINTFSTMEAVVKIRHHAGHV